MIKCTWSGPGASAAPAGGAAGGGGGGGGFYVRNWATKPDQVSDSLLGDIQNCTSEQVPCLSHLLDCIVLLVLALGTLQPMI